MKRVMNIFLIAAIVCSLPFGCEKKERTRTAIQGQVTDENGKPLADVAVLLDGTRYTARTNKEGKFTITGFPLGIYTAVAAQPGYLPGAHYNIEVTQQKPTARIHLVLKRDPEFVPDSLKIVDIQPVPESVLPPGRDISISFRVEYTLTSAGYATIAVSYQDDRGQSLIPMPSQVTVTQQRGKIPFGQRIRVPARMNGKVNVIAAMFISGQSESRVADMVTYYVRPFADKVTICEVTLDTSSDWGKGKQVSLITAVEYLLRSEENAEVVLQVRGDLQNERFEVILSEQRQKVTRSAGEKGRLTFRSQFAIPQNVSAVRARADLIPEGMTEPLVIHWSKAFSTEGAFDGQVTEGK